MFCTQFAARPLYFEPLVYKTNPTVLHLKISAFLLHAWCSPNPNYVRNVRLAGVDLFYYRLSFGCSTVLPLPVFARDCMTTPNGCLQPVFSSNPCNARSVSADPFHSAGHCDPAKSSFHSDDHLQSHPSRNLLQNQFILSLKNLSQILYNKVYLYKHDIIVLCVFSTLNDNSSIYRSGSVWTNLRPGPSRTPTIPCRLAFSFYSIFRLHSIST